MALSKEESRVILFNEVYVPAFVEKCAEFGVTFNSAEELALALENSALVKSACEQLETEQTTNIMKTANEKLRGIFGINEPQSQPEKQAAAPNTQVREAIGALINAK